MSELYVVATPIGNLGDISARALQVLAEVDIIAAEDTRHSRTLLQHFGIGTRMLSYHEHNEAERTQELLRELAAGRKVALISDAGTPMISDPGYHLVRCAHQEGIVVIPVPGASALTAALSASGLPSDRFVFEGFLPARQTARRQQLQELVQERRTLIFYESCHRIQESLADMAAMFGAEREATLARELTKRFETIRQSTLGSLLQWLSVDENQQRGEFVVLVRGSESVAQEVHQDQARRMLELLLQELPLKQAVSLAAKLSGGRKNELYQLALALTAEASQ